MEKKENNNGLTPKQLRFVEEYLIDLNAKQAAIRAGYSPTSAEFQGSKLLNDSKVSQVIKERQGEISKQFDISREGILKDLIEIKDNNKKEDPSISIKAIEVLNKMLGFNLPDKIEHSGNLPVTVIKVTEIKKGE